MAVIAITIFGGTVSAAQAAGTSAINCTPYGSEPCLMPFPNDLFTKKDKSTVTGKRLHLPQAAMPVGSMGPIDTGPYNMNDGFDPGSAIIDRVPGLDTPAALSKTGAVPQKNIGRYKDKGAPIVLIDEKSGKRKPIWVELDSTSPSVDTTTILIHPAKLLKEGHTFVVALRNVKDEDGEKLKAPKWFKPLRDGKPLPKSEKGQAKRYDKIFKSLKDAGIGRKSLYEAWDFTVSSRKSLTLPVLRMRDDAFEKLGDKNLGDGKPQGDAPSFDVTSTVTTGLPPGIAKNVEGTFQVPCYLTSDNCAIGGSFNYAASSGPYQRPKQPAGNMATAHFACAIPSSATAADPARAMIYGHGLFGDDGEAERGTEDNTASLAADHNLMSCGTEWWGLARDPSCTPGPCDPGTENDFTYDAGVLTNLSTFPTIGDRLEQAFLNQMFLGRLMRNPAGLASDPAFQGAGGKSVFDTKHLYYYGNSQGSTTGAGMVALAPDFRRAVLGVPGTDYGALLLQRSTDFVGGATPLDVIIKSSYTDTSQYTLILDIVEQIWDRAETEGYLQHLTANPLPGTPVHTVLMHVAYGDHQVSMYSAAVEARTIGAKAYMPHGKALDTSRLGHDKHLFYGIDPLPKLPFDGSGIVLWDSGPGRVSPPPYGNVPPPQSNPQTAPDFDPHSDPRKTVAARRQISAFLNDARGKIIDQCSNAPCHTDLFVP